MKYLKDLTQPSGFQEFTPEFTLENLLARPMENTARVSEIVERIERDVLAR